MNSCLYEGQLRHRRFTPRGHTFDYRVCYAWLDLDELETVFDRRWLWSTRRPAPIRFRRSDYLGDPALPLKQAVSDRVHGVTGRRPAGPICLLTHLRHFGHNFNPVSFYFCFDAQGEQVETVVAEVTNTPWGERHAYVLPRPDDTPPFSPLLRFRLNKSFHISPFMPMNIRYDWRFMVNKDYMAVHLENHDDDGKVFDATLSLTRSPLDARHCASVLLRYPLMTVKVISAIYWQALRLYLKGIPFHSHPKEIKH